MGKKSNISPTNVGSLSVPQVIEIVSALGGGRKDRRQAERDIERIARAMFTHSGLLERIVRGIIESKGDPRLIELTLSMYPLAFQDLLMGKTTTILNMIDSLLKVHIRCGGDPVRGVDSTAIIFRPFFMTNIMGLPQTITYQWLFEVLKLARNGHDRARQYVHIGLFSAATRNIHFIPQPFQVNDIERISSLLKVNYERIREHQNKQDLEPVELYLPLPPDLIPTFQNIQAGIDVYIEQYRKDLEVFLTAVEEHAEKLTARSHKLWDEICTKQKYAIRDNGVDRVVIDVRLLNYAGVQEIAFFHEGFVAPAVGVRVTLDFWGERTSFKTSFSERGLVCGSKDPWPAWFMALMSVVVLDAYHRIVVEDERGARHYQRVNVQGRGDRDCKEKRWIVRPFLKHLRPGDRISQEAIKAAQYYLGKAPPTGFTFVHEHSRGHTPDAKADMKPLFIYTMHDLSNLIS